MRQTLKHKKNISCKPQKNMLMLTVFQICTTLRSLATLHSPKERHLALIGGGDGLPLGELVLT